VYSKPIDRLARVIEQYGFWQAVLIVIRAILKRLFRISWLSFYVMHMDLKRCDLTDEKDDFKEIKALKPEDFDNNMYKDYINKQKRQIISDRLTNRNIEGFGLFKDGFLACYGWIQYDRLEITSSTSLPLPDKSALLLDDFTHPSYRRQGLHYLINKYRINRMHERGVEHAYVVVIDYNKPAIKTQSKCGLKIIQTFTIWTIGKKEICTAQFVK
jgi:GNAT superfamily N-acetyltransferase